MGKFGRMLCWALGGLTLGTALAQARDLPPRAVASQAPSRLLVVWTSGDREVALKMVFMYTMNARKRGWWDEIRFLIWGPSAKLLASDEELRAEIGRMKEAGIELLACKACADLYGVSDNLSGLGVEVKFMGVPLTEMLKGDWKTITF